MRGHVVIHRHRPKHDLILAGLRSSWHERILTAALQGLVQRRELGPACVERRIHCLGSTAATTRGFHLTEQLDKLVWLLRLCLLACRLFLIGGLLASAELLISVNDCARVARC